MNQALREILAIFKVDNSDLKKGIAEGEKFVDGLKDSLKDLAGPLVAALSGGAIIGFAHDLLESADATSKLADSLGLGIVELQGWDHAANMSGVQTELLTMAFGKLHLGLNEVAEKGKGPAAEALKALGIEAEITEGKLKTSGQVLEEVADAIQGMDVTKRNAALMKLFGEQGAKLVPMLKGGSASVRALRNEVEELGFAFDDEFAAGAEEFNDNMTRLTKAGQGFLTQVLGPIMPELVHLSNELIKASKAAIPLVKQFVAIAKQSHLLASGGLLIAITNFAKLGAVIKVATSAALRFLVPLLAIDDLLTFLAGGDSYLGEKLDEWFGDGTADKVRASLQGLTEDVKTFVGDALAWFERFKSEVIPIFDEWGPRILRVGAVLVGFAVGFKAVAIATALATAAMEAYAAIMVLWTLKAHLVKMLFGTMRIAAALFNATLWANPMALVIGAVIAALALLAAYWPEVSGFFTKLWEHVRVIGANITDAFAGVWNSIVTGAQAALRTAANLISKIPIIGGTLAGGHEYLADAAGGLKMSTDATERVQAQLAEARAAIADELAAKAEPGSVTAGPSTSYYSTNDVQQTTNVNVTVPPGTPDNLADRVGAAAARGAKEGSGRNLRASFEALVPRPAG